MTVWQGSNQSRMLCRLAAQTLHITFASSYFVVETGGVAY